MADAGALAERRRALRLLLALHLAEDAQRPAHHAPLRRGCGCSGAGGAGAGLCLLREPACILVPLRVLLRLQRAPLAIIAMAAGGWGVLSEIGPEILVRQRVEVA